MKQKIGTLLLFSCIFFTACQKKSVDPQPTSSIEKTTSTQGTSSLNSDTAGNNVNGFLRLQVSKDSVNSDNILISFNPSAKTIYVAGEDAPTFQGFGQVSLSSLSSDNIPLAINTLPLTNKGLKIQLKVGAKIDGVYSLDMKAISGVPAMYEIWLMDNYKKDSLDYRSNSTYAFNVYNADTASVGSNRFKLVIRQK
jgi:hypothetical protein